MSKTTNYQLTLWDYADEDFTPKQAREDLAANFTKLDTALKTEETARQSAVNTLNAALAAKATIVTGTYTGDGEASQTISLGFTPRAVLVRAVNGAASDNYRTYSSLAVTGQDAVNKIGDTILALTANGFRACYSSQESSGYLAPRVNTEGQKYNYLAVK